MEEISRFNIRVYGIVINSRNELLLCHEMKDGIAFTKFPGGGLEFGEGLIECLEREFREEMNMRIKKADHFYTTEKFQQSAFVKTEQLISVYYTLELDGEPDLEKINSMQGIDFAWKPLSQLGYQEVTFPIDQLVLKKILGIS
jgi:8-oxo-dGTP diphosphatase